jgi:GTP-binding protein EngB required for normal cell division
VARSCRTARNDLVLAHEMLAPFLEPTTRLAVQDAVARAESGHARVLVMGEAKRGKTTLINALFDHELLPTGVLPLTSVATVVRVGSQRQGWARDLHGTWRELRIDEVADLVSERGNPGNERRVDHVLVTSPTAHLPEGTEVVDTPGTGSVQLPNTEEAQRAREVLDVAVLVVSVDPPVSAAELDLLAEAHERAARAAVVVNKVDLVDPADVAEVVDFTQRVVNARVGQVPIFPLSARGERPEDAEASGIDAFLSWLDAQVVGYGAEDAARSARQLLRRHADDRRDSVRVERELRVRQRQGNAAIRDALRGVLDRAQERAAVAADRLTGEARRLRSGLDREHEQAVAAAVTGARGTLARRLPELTALSPEKLHDTLRSEISDATRTEVHTWFQRRHEHLRDRLEVTACSVLDDLNRELDGARENAGELLQFDLATSEEIPSPAAFPPPHFDATPGLVWQELVSATLVRHLPAQLRRRRVHRDLDQWVTAAIPRPYGRARAELQRELETATRTLQEAIHELRATRMAALESGIDAVADAHLLTDADNERHLSALDGQERDLTRVLALLDV